MSEPSIKTLDSAEIPSGNGKPKAAEASVSHSEPVTVEKQNGTEQLPEELFKPDQSKVLEAKNELQRLMNATSQVRAFMWPYFIIFLIMLATFQPEIFEFIFRGRLSNDFRPARVLILWAVAAIFVGPFYYFAVQSRVSRARDLLKQAEAELEITLNTSIKGRLWRYRDKLSKLSALTAKTFFYDNDRYEEAAALREKAGDALDEATETLSAVKLNDIETDLGALEELINRERREQREQRSWQMAALLIMSLYIAGLVTAVILAKTVTIETKDIFGVPNRVIMWGAAGSLAAILFRFYNEQGRIRFASEFRWLIARPIIGIIMGAVVFLALNSGLILLGASPASAGSAVVERIEVYSVIAFLAGFSDKFYLGVIDLLVSRTIKTEEVSPNKIITEIQRTPPAPEMLEEEAAKKEQQKELEKKQQALEAEKKDEAKETDNKHEQVGWAFLY